MKTLFSSNLLTLMRPAAALALCIGSFAASAQMPAASASASASAPMSMSMKGMTSKDNKTAGQDKMMSGGDMKQPMAGMQEKMGTMTMTGDADYDFASMMRMHHQGAVDMAQAELDNGKNPAMRAAAKKIITSQKKEIIEFDRWMKDHPAKATK